MKNFFILTLIGCSNILQVSVGQNNTAPDGQNSTDSNSQNDTSSTENVEYTQNATQKILAGFVGCGPFDIVHIIDTSENVTQKGFRHAKTAAKTLNWVYNFLNNFGPNGSRGALIKFSNDTDNHTATVQELMPDTNITDFNTAVDDLVYDAGSTRATGQGLILAKEQFTKYNNTENQRIVFLFITGLTDAEHLHVDPSAQARILKSEYHAELCVHAIGSSPHPILETMASPGCFYRHPNTTAYVKSVKKAAKLFLKERKRSLTTLDRGLTLIKKKNKKKKKNRKGP